MTTKVVKIHGISNSEMPMSVERIFAPLTIVQGIDTTVKTTTTVENFLNTLQRTDDEAMAKRNHVRTLAKEKPAEYKKLKSAKNGSLNGFIPGHFSKRDDKSCSQYLPLLVFDIDGVASLEDTLSIIGDAANSPYIFAAFPSPSGLGCRILVWTNATVQTHKKLYQAVINHLSAILEIPTDKDLRKQLKSQNLSDAEIRKQIKQTPHIDSSTSNISRHFYYTPVGKHLYLNENSKTFIISDIKSNTVKPNHISEILPNVKFQLLERIAQQRGKGRNCTTFDIACMFFENGISETDTLSYCLNFEELHTSDKFDRTEIERTVKSAFKTVSDKNAFGKYNDDQLIHYAETILGETVVFSIVGQPSIQKRTKKTVNRKPKEETKLGDKIPKIIILENYLKERYDFRYNNLSNVMEAKGKSDLEFEEMDENKLIVDIYKQGINGFRPQLEALLGSRCMVEEFDPVLAYCKTLSKWKQGDKDYIADLASYVETDDKEWFTTQLKKMLVRTLACSLKLIPFNKQCFTLYGKQNDGKSTFIRFLCPDALKNYFTEDIDFQSKDGRIALATNFLINLDELDSLQFKEVALVKKFITTTKVKVRVPFAKRAKTMTRRVSFFATTNEPEFLRDATGNVRWLIMKINGIKHDFGGKNGYQHNIDIDLVYSQAYALLQSGFDYQLTNEEIKKSEANNGNYQIRTPEMDLVSEYFMPSEAKDGEFVTATFIANEIQTRTALKLSPRKVGKALQFLKFKRANSRIEGFKTPRKGYYVKKLYDVDRTSIIEKK